LDYYLWRLEEYDIYATSVDTIDELTQRIKNCCQQIRNKPEIFERVRSSMKRHAELCVKMDEGHIEHIVNLSYFLFFTEENAS